MIMRDDWDKKRGKFDGSVHYPLIRIMSTWCRRGGEWRKKKKIGDSSSFRSSLLSSLHSSWLSAHSSFFFTSFIITHHSLIHSSIHSSNHPLYYPLIRFGVPTNPIKPKPKFQKAEKKLAGFQPPHQIGLLIELVGIVGINVGIDDKKWVLRKGIMKSIA
jgi:hypothetical protein